MTSIPEISMGSPTPTENDFFLMTVIDFGRSPCTPVSG